MGPLEETPAGGCPYPVTAQAPKSRQTLKTFERLFMIDATSSQETRDAAREIKFIVHPDTAGRIREWARARMTSDPFAGGEWGDEYSTSSIYLDTPQLDVFYRRGSFGRSKYRIRRYGAADVAFLERKLRVATLLSKRRTTVPLAALDLLEQGQIDGWAGAWFARRVQTRELAPVLQVSYRRTARLGLATWGPMRLTIDHAIVARPSSTFAFQGGTGTPVLDERNIVELKFRLEMPAVFKHLVEEFALEAAAVSKYRLSAACLGLSGVSPAVAPVAENRLA